MNVSTLRVKWNFALLTAIVFLLFGGWALAQSSGEADKTPKLYFFTSESCGPCKRLEPELAKLLARGHRVTKVDVDRHPDWANAFNITSTPTCVIVSGTERMGTCTGVASLEQLEQAMGRAYALAGIVAPQSKQTPAVMVSNTAGSGKRNDNWESQAGRDIGSSRSSAVDADAIDRAFQATVRIRVEDELGVSHGTGTVIHATESAALVLTCGHIFRDGEGRGEISVEYGFSQLQDSTQTVAGRLLAYDWDARDVALVSIRLQKPIEPVPVAWLGQSPAKDQPAFSIGCSRGDRPSVNHCNILRVARYGLEGHSETALKIDTTVRPVDGRSGGGLFDAQGRLIGVCNAADVNSDEGIYSAVENVQWQVQQVGLAKLFQMDGSQQAVFASKQGQSVPSTASVAGNRRRTSPSQVPRITLSLETADGQSRQVTIDDPSSELLDLIDSEARSRAMGARMASAPEMPDLSGVPGSQSQQFRGQSPLK